MKSGNEKTWRKGGWSLTETGKMFIIFYCIDNKVLKTKVRMIQISGLVEHVKIQEADKAKGQAHSHMSLKVDK